METNAAVAALSALAHEGRLAIFRELIKAGAEGLPAGEVARRLEMLPNSLSANLAILSHAGLARSWRAGRSIIYVAEFTAMQALIGFLLKDCCGGGPEVCAPEICAPEICAPAFGAALDLGERA